MNTQESTIITTNEYFNDIMFKYFLLLIEEELYSTRKNSIFVSKEIYTDRESKCIGVLNAIKELQDLGEKVLCYNFCTSYESTLTDIDKSTFIRKNQNSTKSTLNCDILIIFEVLNEYSIIKQVIDYYNPKYIFYL